MISYPLSWFSAIKCRVLKLWYGKTVTIVDWVYKESIETSFDFLQSGTHFSTYNSLKVIHTQHIHTSLLRWSPNWLYFIFNMVHNKLSVIFILIASAIAPVVAPPPPVTSHNVHGSPIAHGPPRPPGHSSPPSHPSPESPHNPSPHRTSQIEGSSSNPGQASSSSSKIPSSGERKFEFINYSENDKGKTVETGKRTKVPRAEHGFDPSSNSGHYIEDSSYKPTTKK